MQGSGWPGSYGPGFGALETCSHILNGPDEDQRTEDQEQRDQPVGRGADIQGTRPHHRQPHHTLIYQI